MERYQRIFKEKWFTLVDFEEVLNKRNIKWKKKQDKTEITYLVRVSPSVLNELQDMVYKEIPDGKIGKQDIYIQHL